MESGGNGDHFGEQVDGSGPVQWPSAMSSFMLSNLCNLVASGAKTTKGFKKVHLNMCARALNEHFKTARTGDHIKNHLKTWQRKYTNINRLRKLSAAGWDEDNFIITLDHEHYTNHVKDHKSDAEYLNKPLEHYAEMATIFGNSMATGRFAKGSSEPLGTEEGENESEDGAAAAGNDGLGTPDDPAASSSASRPPKRARLAEAEDDGLVAALKSVGKDFCQAITKAATAATDVPEDLFQTLNSLPGFEQPHISYYYHHLVANPHIARAFYNLPFSNKLDWVSMFISEKFPGF